MSSVKVPPFLPLCFCLSLSLPGSPSPSLFFLLIPLLYPALRTLFLHFLGAVGFWPTVWQVRETRGLHPGEAALSAASVPPALAVLLGWAQQRLQNRKAPLYLTTRSLMLSSSWNSNSWVTCTQGGQGRWFRCRGKSRIECSSPIFISITPAPCS